MATRSLFLSTLALLLFIGCNETLETTGRHPQKVPDRQESRSDSLDGNGLYTPEYMDAVVLPRQRREVRKEMEADPELVQMLFDTCTVRIGEGISLSVFCPLKKSDFELLSISAKIQEKFFEQSRAEQLCGLLGRTDLNELRHFQYIEFWYLKGSSERGLRYKITYSECQGIINGN